MRLKKWSSDKLKGLKGCFLCGSNKDDVLEIYRDKNHLVVLDKYPPTKGYTLVALKKHKSDISELTEKEYVELNKLVYRTSKAIRKAFKPKRIVLLQSGIFNNHFHFHIIPMYEDIYMNLLNVITKKTIIDFSKKEWGDIRNKIKRFL